MLTCHLDTKTYINLTYCTQIPKKKHHWAGSRGGKTVSLAPSMFVFKCHYDVYIPSQKSTNMNHTEN